jgi:hypothetical protein
MARGPRKLAIRFGATALTHYGGVYLLHRFLSRIGFKTSLARQIRLIQRNNRYSLGKMLLAVLYPMILGLERLETTHLLRQNGVFQYLTGLPRYPDATTLRRFLLRVAPAGLPQLRALHDRVLHQMTGWPRGPTRLIVDVDSTVLVLYGNQEHAKIGYTPIKRGRPSYPPCSASRAGAKTSAMGNCGLAMSIRPAGHATSSQPASRRFPPESDW